MDPRFSILLPTHDRADVIGHAIASALYQSDPDFELLVVCDGCTSDTVRAVQAFSDPRIRLFELPKAPGFGWANRNEVLRQARGELVAFLGDDDLWFPDHLESFARSFEDERIEWAYSRPLFMADDGVAVPTAVDLRRPQELEWFLTVGNSVPAACVVHRRSLLERYGYWPAELWQGEQASAIDWELWRRMVGPSNGANLDYVSVPTCFHFRAGWRNPSDWTIAGLTPWTKQAREGWWPPALRSEIPTDVAPQAALWRKLATDGDRFVARVRAAVTTVIDGFAWEAAADRERVEQALDHAAALERALATQTSHTDGLSRSLADQTERADALAGRLAQADALTASILASRSWRVMAPLRHAGRIARSVARLWGR
jgi:hypothetical protein